MGVLTREDILKVEDLKVEKVEVPEWGGDIFIAEMSGDARDEFEQYAFAQSGKKTDYVHIRAALVAMCAVNEKRERLFSFEDIKALGQKNGLILDRLFDVANRLNKIFGSQREDVAKNSETPQGDSSGGG
jgi:hypothetical protein